MELKLTPDFLERWYVHGAILMLAAGGTALGLVVGQHFGRAEGKAQAQLEHKAQALDAVQTMLLNHAQLVTASQEVSTELRAAAAQRQETNTQTSKELAHALSQTAGSRAGCRLDAASLQHLQNAASRAAAAANAARAGRSAGAVPATTPAARR